MNVNWVTSERNIFDSAMSVKHNRFKEGMAKYDYHYWLRSTVPTSCFGMGRPFRGWIDIDLRDNVEYIRTQLRPNARRQAAQRPQRGGSHKRGSFLVQSLCVTRFVLCRMHCSESGWWKGLVFLLASACCRSFEFAFWMLQWSYSKFSFPLMIFV